MMRKLILPIFIAIFSLTILGVGQDVASAVRISAREMYEGGVTYYLQTQPDGSSPERSFCPDDCDNPDNWEPAWLYSPIVGVPLPSCEEYPDVRVMIVQKSNAFASKMKQPDDCEGGFADDGRSVSPGDGLDTVQTASDCTGATDRAIWILRSDGSEACHFEKDAMFNVPLIVGYCYDHSSDRFKIVTCPGGTDLSLQCAVYDAPGHSGGSTSVTPFNCVTGALLLTEPPEEGEDLEPACEVAEGEWTQPDGAEEETCVCPDGTVPNLVGGETCRGSVVDTDRDYDGRDGDTTIATDIECESEEIGENCGVIKYILLLTRALSAIAGVSIVASIMIAGYQYMTARDNSGQVQAARTRIMWAIVALMVYIFMFAFLEFMIPGGLL